MPDLTFDFDTYLAKAKAQLPWIRVIQCGWPRKAAFGDGIVANFSEKSNEQFAKWAEKNLAHPALAFTNRCRVAVGHSVGFSGQTFKAFPISLIFTVFKSRPINEEVLQLTVLHELLHMARNIRGALDKSEVDDEGHCRSTNCVLKAAKGDTEDELEKAVIQRGDAICESCLRVLEEVKASGVWS